MNVKDLHLRELRRSPKPRGIPLRPGWTLESEISLWAVNLVDPDAELTEEQANAISHEMETEVFNA